MRISLLVLTIASLSPAIAVAASETSSLGVTTMSGAGTLDGAPSDVFFVDLAPEYGLVTYSTPEGEAMKLGGLACVSPATFKALTRNLAFPHNIAPWGDVFVTSETERSRVLVVTPSGEITEVIERVVWKNCRQEALRKVNWILPIERREVELFLGTECPALPLFLVCCQRRDAKWKHWWTTC